MIDIRDYPKALDAVNAVLNNHGTAEVKNEIRYKDGKIQSDNITVVEISRRLKSSEEK